MLGLVAVVVVLLAAAGALAATQLGKTAAPAAPSVTSTTGARATGSGPSRGPALPTSSTSAPPPTTAPPSPPTTVDPAAQIQAQALSSLVANSAVDRSVIIAAVLQISSCGDLYSAQQTLQQAAASRQSLLEQLGQLQFGALPDGEGLEQALQSAWQASLDADSSYAAYAGDEISNFSGCVPDDSGDTNAQAASASDQQATSAKQQFAALWDPIAATYGLPQWQASAI